MKVAIIGTGNMGAGLAAALATNGHEVSIGARDLVKAAALADKIGHGAVGGGMAAAAKLADVIILALPFAAAADAIRQAGDLTGKVLVDIANPISADYKELVIGHTTSAAEEVQKLAPQAKVVKAFNTIFAQLLAPEARQGTSLQVFIAGDDGAAKEAVSALAQSAGFTAVDAGPLSNSRYLEPIGEMNIHFGYFLGQGPTVAPAWVPVRAS
jgi:NADPH-dependent F420 reductase